MRLSDMFDEDHILVDLKAKDKKEVLEELAQVITGHDPSLEKSSLVKVLLERERLGSTGIGDGVAIPHGKFQGIDQPIISFGRSRKGLDFESMDGAPAYLFFLLVAPENSASIHLKALARIAKILKNSSFRKTLMEASSREEIYRTIIQNDEEF
ncbi:MAG: PTS fructose transporter subunit IIA [Deltaproteobacteria bacterium HGW-Deltaproteobacteria-21]|jgi:PTS system nitrogen regulatory IIA component|nr:MAG: PTS fructose transporter subunit IIA [Deltaproteobacteria bacterium HGW-Deltaproteobacteria-21]PKN66708.1 MAG: PTS fructose transporter subunit IIA [Deltaproteobacteria bacterium HGW-Deltaproteobacteria-15]